jgi:hypothetical protein
MADNAHLLLCNGATLARAARTWSDAHTQELRTGDGGNVRIEIPLLAKSLSANVPDVFADLAEIAAFVYSADQAISRSGTVTFDYGDRWIRKLRFEIAVRCPDFWNQAAVSECLIEALGFMTEDAYEFRFTKNPTPTAFERFLGFGESNPEGIEKVMLFSGGIDSLAGAVEEVLHNGKKVALVSHWPVSHLGSRQDRLASTVAGRVSNKDRRPLHFKVLANKIGEIDHEHTQRSRSFLFSSIASVVARIFGIDGIDFFENGVVSVNLPLCEQEKNGRASRTTHPQTIHRLEELLSLVAGRRFSVKNHYLPYTKQDVVEKLTIFGHADLLSESISCTHTRGFTLEQPHCGLCSQCLSRKFATAGANLDAHDPDSKYRADVFIGERPRTVDRTLAERFVGVAREIEMMTDRREFQQLFANEIGRVTPYLPGANKDIVGMLFDLHHRHSVQVGAVIEDKMKKNVSAYRQGFLARTSTLWFAFELAKGGAASDNGEPHGGGHRDSDIREQVGLLNEMQRCILQALLEKDVTDPDIDELPSQRMVADWAGYPYDTSIKNELTALVKMQLLGNGKQHGRRGGYYLKGRGVQAAKLLCETTSHD